MREYFTSLERCWYSSGFPGLWKRIGGDSEDARMDARAGTWESTVLYVAVRLVVS